MKIADAFEKLKVTRAKASATSAGKRYKYGTKTRPVAKYKKQQGIAKKKKEKKGKKGDKSLETPGLRSPTSETKTSSLHKNGAPQRWT